MLNLLPSCITEEDNDFLTKIPDEAEIRKTLKQMHPWKAPGPDGFSPVFFNKIGAPSRLMSLIWFKDFPVRVDY